MTRVLVIGKPPRLPTPAGKNSINFVNWSEAQALDLDRSVLKACQQQDGKERRGEFTAAASD